MAEYKSHRSLTSMKYATSESVILMRSYDFKLQRRTGLTKQKQNLSENQMVGNHGLKATLKK